MVSVATIPQMGPVVADLHVHTRRSDGTTPPSALASVAAAHGLSVVAVTDHDRLPPADLPRDGPAVIGGIELRVAAAGVGRIDLLGYGVDRSNGRLAAAVDRLQANRIERARAMRDRLEATLGVDLEVDLDRGVGRPHLARAVADRTDLSYGAVFERYIGEDGPCYVPRDVPTFDRGRRLLSSACRLVVLAHPMRYESPRAALALADALDGVEYYYPYADPDALERLDDALEAGVVKTGGSDAHTTEAIGSVGLDREGLEPVAHHLDVEGD